MVCTACHHPNRDDIDRQIVAGSALRILAASTGLSVSALHRHKQHVRETLRRAQQEERTAHGSDLLQRTQRLTDEAIGILESAKATNNLKAAVSAICAAVRCLELCGRLDGSLAQPNAPGLHLTMNRVTNNTIINYGDDVDFAKLIGEGTRGFDVAELMRLKAIAESTSVQQA